MTQDAHPRRALATLCVVGAMAAAFVLLVRPRYRYWGATPAERERHMPLDERLPGPATSTRAITIDVPPERVWPWIVQMGSTPRAGYYSYAWVERLQGMQIDGVEHILPEYQELHVGDALDAGGRVRVLAVEPGRFLVIGQSPDVTELEYTWALVLESVEGGRTRLISRARVGIDALAVVRSIPFFAWPFWALLDPGMFIMERKMLLKIKQLAESTQSVPEAAPASRGRAAEGDALDQADRGAGDQ